MAATPKTVGQLVGLGYDVVVERGAGDAATFRDEAYEAAGRDGRAAPPTSGRSDVVAKVNAPTDDEVAALRPGATLVAMLAPASGPDARRATCTRAA